MTACFRGGRAAAEGRKGDGEGAEKGKWGPSNEVPELPAEAGLAAEHVEAVAGAGTAVEGVAHEAGGGGVVDEVEEEEVLEAVGEGGEGCAADVGPGAEGGGVDDEEGLRAGGVGQGGEEVGVGDGTGVVLGLAADEAVGDAELAQGPCHGAGGTAGAEDEGLGGTEAEGGEAVAEGGAVGVVADQAAVGADDDAVDGANGLGLRPEGVEQRQDGLLVGVGDVEARDGLVGHPPAQLAERGHGLQAVVGAGEVLAVEPML